MNKYYTIDNIDVRDDPHKKYIADIEADADSWSEFATEETDEEKLTKIAFLLGVEKVTKNDIDQFLESVKSVKPRKVEGNFGKLSRYLNQYNE